MIEELFRADAMHHLEQVAGFKRVEIARTDAALPRLTV